jgi:hypothetical protein
MRGIPGREQSLGRFRPKRTFMRSQPTTTKSPLTVLEHALSTVCLAYYVLPLTQFVVAQVFCQH